MGELGFIGGSGLLWRVNNQASTHTPSGNRGNSRPTPGPTACRPLSNPCVPAVDTGTRLAKPLGITGCPAGQWTSAGPLDKAEAQQGPPGGGAGAPQGMRNPFTFLGQNSHPQFTTIYPPSTPTPPHPTYDAHLVNRGEQRLRKGVYRVSGCWSLGPGVSRPKPIGDYRYL